MIKHLMAVLKATGRLDNTYFVFSSDNGLHIGEHRLAAGKLTAFDTDIHVPLIVVGPEVRSSYQATSFAQNIDLRSTFDAWAGTAPSETVDGRSLVPLMSDRAPAQAPRDWPQGALIEHHGPVLDKSDPDYQDGESANPPSYGALRLPGALYVEYVNGEKEYYDLRSDPYELDNVYTSLPKDRKASLHRQLVEAESCHGPAQCGAPFEAPRSGSGALKSK
jgi:arylsulfatase A-like enzyme